MLYHKNEAKLGSHIQLNGGTRLSGSDCSGFIHGPGSLFIEAIPLKSVALLMLVFPYFVKR